MAPQHQLLRLSLACLRNKLSRPGTLEEPAGPSDEPLDDDFVFDPHHEDPSVARFLLLHVDEDRRPVGQRRFHRLAAYLSDPAQVG